MGDRSLDDFLDGDDDGDDTEESPDRAEEAVDDDPADTADGDREGAETDVDDEPDASADGIEGETGEEGEVDDDEADEGDGPRVDPTTVEPAEATYAWSGDGNTCAACGETVERRWRSDDGLVCPDCKEW